MTNLLTYSVAPTLALMIALPAQAQDFDLPPDLPGYVDESVTPQDAVADVPDASEDVIEDASVDVADVPELDDATGVPDLEEVPEVDGVPELAAADDTTFEAEEDPRFSFGRNATLELEARVFANTDLSGDTSHALRLQAHYFGSWEISDRSSVIFNLRARTDKVDGVAYRFEDDFNFDVQELAFSYAPNPGTTFQIGRINIRNGVASGFNPTDWFKDDSLVVTGSAAPSDRRNERLGVLALTATTSIGDTLVTLGYRPKIDADPDTIWTDRDNFGLGLDRTNPSEAWFIKATPNIGDNLSLTANALLIDDEPGIGFELSGTVGDNLVLYSEVMAQKRLSLADEALGATLGSAGFRSGVGAGKGKEWHTQAALGLNWALPQPIVGARDVSLTFEYHLNSAGLTSGQIDALSGAAGPDLAAAGALYGLANRRQEPLAREQLFTRFAWNDFWGDSDMSLLGFYVPADGSGLAQISIDVPVGDNGLFNLRGITTFGDDQSVYGANPTKSSVQMGLTYTF
ncbi:hypothetical protein ACOXXX_10760 [Thalassococcus sp. BH17M4-6]|uniref:hypothetical protein n=1 Tax=Thalassococcus sp. BH17M4-6 TaxID=3413148 RepID=UPI003BCC02EF